MHAGQAVLTQVPGHARTTAYAHSDIACVKVCLPDAFPYAHCQNANLSCSFSLGHWYEPLP